MELVHISCTFMTLKLFPEGNFPEDRHCVPPGHSGVPGGQRTFGPKVALLFILVK